MVKFLLKGIIFFMGVQSLMGKLQQEGIITGSIKINYPVLQEKIVSIIKSDELNVVVKKLSDEIYLTEANARVLQNNGYRSNHVLCHNHVVQKGETLSNLAEIYGVPWQAIKKANHISDVRKLQIGQHLIIPDGMSGLG